MTKFATNVASRFTLKSFVNQRAPLPHYTVGAKYLIRTGPITMCLLENTCVSSLLVKNAIFHHIKPEY